jgi:hypothetical protein
MYACIIFYILLSQDIITSCFPVYSIAGISYSFIHEYDLI